MAFNSCPIHTPPRFGRETDVIPVESEAPDAQQRFLTEDGRALGNSLDFTRKAEGLQVVEESVVDVCEHRMPNAQTAEARSGQGG